MKQKTPSKRVRMRVNVEWLLTNSLYWTIRNWFLVRRIAKKDNWSYSGITCERTYMDKDIIKCFDNCNMLEMDYFETRDGGFSTDNICWCLDNGESKRIW